MPTTSVKKLVVPVAGVDATLVRIENGGHTLPVDQPLGGRTIQESVREFLDKTLR